MKRKTKGVKKRRPTDATMRNVRAGKRAFAMHENRLNMQRTDINGLRDRIAAVEAWITRQQADAGVPDEQRGFQK